MPPQVFGVLPAWMQAALGTWNLCRTGREAMPMTLKKAGACSQWPSAKKSFCPSSQNRISFHPYTERGRSGLSCVLHSARHPAFLKPFFNKALHPARVLCTLYYVHDPFTFLSSLKTGFILVPGHPFLLLRIVPLVLVSQRTQTKRFTNWTQKKTPQRLQASGAWPPLLLPTGDAMIVSDIPRTCSNLSRSPHEK